MAEKYAEYLPFDQRSKYKKEVWEDISQTINVQQIHEGDFKAGT